MCGIFGIADFASEAHSLNGQGDLSACLAAMGQALAHRGPDDEGAMVFRASWASVGIGMRRLSIIDVANGRQPMTNEDGSVTAVCNGELYNYREVRDELLSRGHRFRTQSDTEVLVHLYEEHGWESVERLRGMFAFALWDARKQLLLLARDRLGIKPLFFKYNQRRLAFASEIRGLLPAFEELPDITQTALLRLLMLQYVPAPDTMFEGTQKLMPGTVLIASEHGIEARQYWRPPVISVTAEFRSETQVAQAVSDRLRDAVTCHLVSDVPVGAFLSGGLDSTALVALMNRAGMPPFHTFSVGFDGPSRFNELSYARQVAEQFGTHHHELVVGPEDVLSCLPMVVSHLDEPLTDPAIVPTYMISSYAASLVKVVLTGEGADELFGGYQRYGLDRLAAWYRWVPSGLRGSLAGWLRRRFVNRRIVQGARALSHDSPARRHMDWVGAFTFEELMEIVSDPADVFREAQELESVFQPYFDSSDQGESAVSGMLRADLSTWLPDDLLTKVDRMSMAASLEARVPYLDHPLVELVASMPSTLKVRTGVRKPILKAAVADLVPAEILNRRKMGFELPLASWMRGPLRSYVVDVVRQEGPPGFFNQSATERFLDQHLKGVQDRSQQLWSLMIVKLWYQTFVRERTGVVCRTA